MSYHWAHCRCGRQATRECDDCGEPLCDRCLCDCADEYDLVSECTFEDPAGAW